MGITAFDQVQANVFIGPRPEANPFGATYFIDGTNGSDSGSLTGLSPRKAFASIGYAISRGVAGDNFVIAPGTYTVTTAIVPLARQFFRAAVINPRVPTVSISGNIADVVQIDVSGTSWYGIEFLAAGNTADNLIDIADGAAVNGAWFVSCVWNGADKTTVIGINANDATFALTGLVLDSCLFRDLTGTMINVGVLGFAYSDIQRNQFAHDVNSGIGIALADTTAFATGKGYRIMNNDFTPFDATGDEVSISVSGTADTTGVGIIRNNYVSYGAPTTSVTANKVDKSFVNNYVGSATTGGDLITP